MIRDGVRDGAAGDAVRRVLAQRGLTLVGLHCHIGSQITSIKAYEQAARRVIDLVTAIRDEHGIEPGRAISARAGITLYRVLGIEHGATGRIFVTVNGGMSDNPRLSLYGARYTARLVGRKAAAGPRAMTVVTSGRVRRYLAPRSRP